MNIKDVLLIDDEKIIRDEFIHLFNNNNEFTLEVASNCIEAMDIISKRNFNIIILDIRMPDFNNRFSENAGIELLQKIKSDNPHQSVIMLSVIKDVELAIKAMKLGASDYIVKDGFTADELFEKLSKIIQENEISLLNKIEKTLRNSKKQEIDRYKLFKLIQKNESVKASQYEKIIELMMKNNKITSNNNIIKLSSSK